MPMPGGPVVAQPYLFTVDASTGHVALGVSRPPSRRQRHRARPERRAGPGNRSVDRLGVRRRQVQHREQPGGHRLRRARRGDRSGVVQKPATRSGNSLAVVGRRSTASAPSCTSAGSSRSWAASTRGRVARLELTSAGFGIDGWTASGAGRRGAGVRRRPRRPREDLPRWQVHFGGSCERPTRSVPRGLRHRCRQLVAPVVPPARRRRQARLGARPRCRQRSLASRYSFRRRPVQRRPGPSAPPKLLLANQFRATGDVQAVNVVGNTVLTQPPRRLPRSGHPHPQLERLRRHHPRHGAVARSPRRRRGVSFAIER